MMDKKKYVYQNNDLAVFKIELNIIADCGYCNVHPRQRKFIRDLLCRTENLKKFTVTEKQKSWIDRIISTHYINHSIAGADEGLLPDYDTIFGKYE